MFASLLSPTFPQLEAKSGVDLIKEIVEQSRPPLVDGSQNAVQDLQREEVLRKSTVFSPVFEVKSRYVDESH